MGRPRTPVALRQHDIPSPSDRPRYRAPARSGENFLSGPRIPACLPGFKGSDLPLPGLYEACRTRRDRPRGSLEHRGEDRPGEPGRAVQTPPSGEDLRRLAHRRIPRRWKLRLAFTEWPSVPPLSLPRRPAPSSDGGPGSATSAIVLDRCFCGLPKAMADLHPREVMPPPCEPSKPRDAREDSLIDGWVQARQYVTRSDDDSFPFRWVPRL